ncbi:type 1 glutamine amidotransferase domain-containing protein [Silvibacterium sp.]|uniref:type 1 glutamine amidotransferase domain-containing protein n=1 Tax=Silvibacterium sp. TaxID=1964179 RepID=UPI0039E39418
MKKLRTLTSAALSLALFAGAAQAQKVLVLVTSAGSFPDGRQTGVWLEEFATPYESLVRAGVEVTVVSPQGGAAPVDPRSAEKPEQVAAWQDAEKALKHTKKLDDTVTVTDYDAIFIPGGHGPLFDLASNKKAAQLIAGFAEAGKPVASVCHGPAAFLDVKLSDGRPFVAGRKLTAFSDDEEQTAGLAKEVPYSVQQRLEAQGAQYSEGKQFGVYTVVDGKLITGQNPASSAKVVELLIGELKK